MRHDNVTTNSTAFDEKQDILLTGEMKKELEDGLFAPMGHSIAVSTMCAVKVRSHRHRSVQSFWLGFSPVLAALLVIGLYTGTVAFSRPSAPESIAAGSALSMPKTLKMADSFTAGLCGVANSLHAETATVSSINVDLGGDGMRRLLLVAWLRPDHGNTAAQLTAATAGQTIVVQLGEKETRDFVALLKLHGFQARDASNLVLFRYLTGSQLRTLDVTVTITP